ncbi:MAG: N-acetylmuramoyl-L-alanine amidase [Peptostreptococcus stomatis]|uniref:N-acetylmuramoyl-L-alanine amidase family protein n=1 Tax=Peptostreptococcus stomatis TaxID=341694 RepID=UPI001A558166|nr:N-acetylmuramoyl-L-alanine amidase [Peptostreptococcus stomatis]MBL6465103.1 N-acetylmuramoyl-L-alanine amidase [Peptostreptococcus stomatis]
MRKLIYVFSLLIMTSLLLAGCGQDSQRASSGVTDQSQTQGSDENSTRSKSKKPDQKNGRRKEDENDRKDKTGKGHTVVIDPGHQEAAMNDLEPIGPGASQSKPMLSSGTSGVVTGVPEYQLALDVSLKLRDELRARGYKVVMIREDNHCPISNRGRAEIANKYRGAVFLRIHANGDSNPATSGMLTMCPASDNPYTPEIIGDSNRLARLVLDQMVKSTGATSKGIIETNNMSGINWCKIPVTIIEMGFMSNPDEDRLLQTGDYQKKIVDGISNGVDKYFEL